MGPLLRQPAGQNRGNLRGYRNRIGFRSEVALNQGFRANSGARSSELWTRNAVELVSFTTGARQRQFLWRLQACPGFRTRSGGGRFGPARRVKTAVSSLLGRLCRGGSRRLTVPGGRQF